jgi:hypothetical protein
VEDSGEAVLSDEIVKWIAIRRRRRGLGRGGFYVFVWEKSDHYHIKENNINPVLTVYGERGIMALL